jgi:hypothetical protein
MDENVYELLKGIDSHLDNIKNWEQITNIFVIEIKRKGLSKSEVEEVNNLIVQGIKKENIIRYKYKFGK